MRGIAAVFVSSVVLLLPAGANAEARDDRRDVVVEPVVDESGPSPVIGVDLDVWIESGAVDFGPDPYAGCDVFGDLSVVDVATLTASPTSPDAELDDEVYVLIRCNAAFVRWWLEGDPVPPEVGDLLVRSARSRIPIVPPEPQMSPDGSAFPFITQLPVWFWLDDAAWSPVQASASIPELGFVVTVTAAPRSVSWNPGDGSAPIVCGQGTAWTAALSVDAVSDCQHTYVEALTPDEGPLIVTNQVTYGFGVSCVPAAICTNVSPPGAVSVTGSQAVRVTQVRGVITS